MCQHYVPSVFRLIAACTQNALAVKTERVISRIKQPYNYQFVKGILYGIDNSLTHHGLRIYAPESCIITREDNLNLELRA